MLVGFFLPEVFPVTMMLSLNLKGHVRAILKKKPKKKNMDFGILVRRHMRNSLYAFISEHKGLDCCLPSLQGLHATFQSLC